MEVKHKEGVTEFWYNRPNDKYTIVMWDPDNKTNRLTFEFTPQFLEDLLKERKQND